MPENKHDSEQISSDAATTPLFVKAFHTALLDHEKILRIITSLKDIQARIDQAYTHICTDLPAINREILLTFQQAADTLDSLSSTGSSGTIGIMIHHLNSFLHMLTLQVRRMKTFTVRSLAALEHTRLSVVDDSGLSGETPLEMQGAVSHGLADHLPAFTGVKNDLKEVLERSLQLQNQCMKKLGHSKNHEVPSLVYSLNNIIGILRDLVSRARLVKDPILKIMSGLQTHDIVNQDIATISCGLQKILSLMSTAGTKEQIANFLIFQEKASMLSLKLIVQLISVIRSHGRDLEEEIDRIEEMILQIKEDKDTIGCFLLQNTHGKSTLDIVSNEVLEMLDSLSSRFDSLAAINSLNMIGCSQMSAAWADLEKTARAVHAQDASPSPTCGPPEGLISCMKSREWPVEQDAIVTGLERMPGDFRKARVLIRRSFDDIKSMLIQSIDGIDLYSARCLEAIERFRCDIKGLMSTLDGNEAMLDDMRSLTRSITAIRSDIDEHLASHHLEILPLELHQIIHRLRNPHSDSIASQDAADSRGNSLTFF
ncbi:MAG: hypothetical protein M0R18_08845 [Deltaproteobacteria bacterium]|nr:hypothetical protein [Deltaproteobacteria bacterium]